MNYEEIEVDSVGGVQAHIVITNEDGSAKSFPANESNPEYAAFLESLNDDTETE
jgi:hypothetical protein